MDIGACDADSSDLESFELESSELEPFGSDSDSVMPRHARMIIATAEHVIAISATLKTGKFGRPMKSTTEPNPGPGR